MTNNEDAFHYTSTLKGRRIRLMYIECHSGLDLYTAPLSVNLVEKNLDAAEFEALSYVWGDQATRVHMKCNGRTVTIGKSLHAALMEYRLRLRRGRGREGNQIRGLWADAICINQSNEMEKTEQVRMMRDIYKAAKCTIIWLGPFEDGDVQAIQLAQVAYTLCPKNLRFEMKGNRQDWRNFNAMQHGVPEPLSVTSRGCTLDPTWKNLFKILHHPWFSRIWIVQELLVSESAEMWRGRKSIEVDILLWMADQIDTHTNLRLTRQIHHPQEGLCFAVIIALFYFRFTEDSPPPLWTNMMNTAGMKATEVLDRFFALAGISNEVPDGFVDYSKTVEAVASQVGLMSLLGSPKNPATDGLDRLADFPSRDGRAQGIQVPTWIPDFLSRSETYARLSILYSTSKWRSKHPNFPLPEFQIVTDPEAPTHSPRPLTVSEFLYAYSKVPELLAKAAMFDRIKETLHPKAPDKWNDDEDGIHYVNDIERYYHNSINLLRFMTTARLLSDPALSLGDDVMSGDMFEPFWRTMIYNRIGDSFVEEVVPDSTVGHSFAYWYMSWKLYLTRKWEQHPELFRSQMEVLEALPGPFADTFSDTFGHRSFFVTESGRIGWAPPAAQPGDLIAMFRGNRIPFVARSLGNRDAWEYVGGCYVHGCMDGEISQLDETEWEFMRFV